MGYNTMMVFSYRYLERDLAPTSAGVYGIMFSGRRRNLSPRDPSKTHRERLELEELKECTFKPVSYTRAYRGGTRRCI